MSNEQFPDFGRHAVDSLGIEPGTILHLLDQDIDHAVAIVQACPTWQHQLSVGSAWRKANNLWNLLHREGVFSKDQHPILLRLSFRLMDEMDGAEELVVHLPHP